MKTKTVIHTPKKVLPGILLAVFLESFCTSVFVPVIALGIGGSRNANLAAIANLQNYALLVVVHLAMQVFAVPLLGQYSDRFGRRVVLSYSLSGAAFGHALFLYGAVTGSFAIMLLGRAVDGITGGTQAIARSVIADVAHNNTRVTYYGLMGGVFTFGAILGTVLGTRSIPGFDIHRLFPVSPFSLAVILAAINMVIVAAILPETNRITRRWSFDWSSTIRYIVKASNARSHRVLFATTFLYMAGASLLLAYAPFILRSTAGFSEDGSEQYVLYVLVCSAVSQAVIAPMLAKLVRSHTVIKLSMAATLVVLPLLVWIGRGNEWPLLFGAAFAIPFGITITNITALVSGTSAKGLQGEILGIDFALHAAAQIIPAVLVLRVGGNNAVLAIAAGVAMIAGAAVLFTGHYRTPAYALKVNQV